MVAQPFQPLVQTRPMLGAALDQAMSPEIPSVAVPAAQSVAWWENVCPWRKLPEPWATTSTSRLGATTAESGAYPPAIPLPQHQVGNHSIRLQRRPGAGSAGTSEHFVRHQQDLVPVAELRGPVRQICRRGNRRAGGRAAYRFADQGGDGTRGLPAKSSARCASPLQVGHSGALTPAARSDTGTAPGPVAPPPASLERARDWILRTRPTARAACFRDTRA